MRGHRWAGPGCVVPVSGRRGAGRAPEVPAELSRRGARWASEVPAEPSGARRGSEVPAESTGASEFPMPDDRRVLEGVERLIVDGTNVLHVLSRTPGPLPPAALIGRLRAIVPPEVAVVVVLDGSPEHGLVSRQIASGVEVRYAGRWTADEAIADIVERQAREGGAVGLLVVTDDIELSGFVRRAGARTIRNTWLVDRLARQRLSSPAPGRPVGFGAGPSGSTPGSRGASGGSGGSGAGGTSGGAGTSGGSAATPPDEEPEVRRWSPGRGATRKRGNPRRGR
jgi:hypothetical protein